MTHWDVAKAVITGGALVAFGVAGWIVGGIVYLG